MTNSEKAAAVGEYVKDAIDVYIGGQYTGGPCTLKPVTLDDIAFAARIAAGHAARAISERWPKFGHDWR